MRRTQRIAEVEVELATLRDLAAETLARLRGKEVELAALKAGAAPAEDLTSIPKLTDAILAVLRSTTGTLSPSEVNARLIASGRDDDLKTISSLLSYLLDRGRVHRPSRGRYLAA